MTTSRVPEVLVGAVLHYTVRMKVFWDPVQLGHAPRFFLQRGQIRPHFEVPARAEALLASCRELGLPIVRPPAPPRHALEAVHPPDFLDFLRDGPAAWFALPGHGEELVPNVHPTPEMLAQGGRPAEALVGRLGWFTYDTASPIAAGTWAAALAASGGAIAAAEEAASGRSAYALARPPGHHSYAARMGGHCYLNNAALAAEHLRRRGAARVAVLDIDSHHGNGTQGIFWERSDVLTISIHGDPDRYYPWFVGRADERGGGAGEGANRNLPLAFGTGDAGWLDAIANRDRGRPSLPRRRAGGEPRLRRLQGRAAERARGDRGRLLPRGGRGRRPAPAGGDRAGGRVQYRRDRRAAQAIP